ncbi:MAG TPA: hypothetical protein VK390_09755 [Propionibacteriaceae bacterium]|nr:hypothetical protein [Propionibacteriaceae bacterium]
MQSAFLFLPRTTRYLTVRHRWAYPTPAAYCFVPFDMLRTHDLAYFE